MAAFVRLSEPWCYPAERPLLPPVLAFAATFGFAGVLRFAAYWAYRARPFGEGFLETLGRDANTYGVEARKATFGGEVVNLKWFVTLSEQWMLWIVRLSFLLSALLSVGLAGACFLQPLPLTCVVLGMVAVCKVSFSAFKKKEHGIDAAITVEIHCFVVCVVNACFVRLEPSVAPGTWLSLLVVGCVVDGLFLLYPGVVVAFRHKAPLAVSAYLVVVELCAFGIVFASVSLVTTATYTPG